MIYVDSYNLNSLYIRIHDQQMLTHNHLLTGRHNNKRHSTDVSHPPVERQVASSSDDLMSPLNDTVQYCDARPQRCMSNTEISHILVWFMCGVFFTMFGIF